MSWRISKLAAVSGLLAGTILSGMQPAYAVDQPYFVGLIPSQPQVPGGLSMQLMGSQNFTWDTNPLLVSSGEKTIFGSVTSPEFILRDSTPTSMISTDTLVNENLFNQSAFNSTDLHESVGMNTQTLQWAAGMQAKFDYDTVRTSELSTFGVNIPNVQHTGFTVSPQISYSPTLADKVSLNTSMSRSLYDNAAFINYDTYDIKPTYAHNFNPNNTGIFAIDAQRYTTTVSNGITTDSIGPTVGWISALTPRLTAAINGGFQKSMTTGGGSQWNYVFGGDFSYKGLQDVADLQASRSQYPFANGTETLLTSFGITDTHTVNQYISLNGGVVYQLANEPQSVSATQANLSSQFMGNAGLAYHIFPRVDITTSYQYRDEKLTGVNGTIQDQVAMIGISYHPLAVTP